MLRHQLMADPRWRGAPRSELPEKFPKLLLPKEAASLFRVDPKTIVRWASEGRIRAIKTPLGGGLRFREDDVQELLKKKTPTEKGVR
jgi:excisionase family DNA binding protein